MEAEAGVQLGQFILPKGLTVLVDIGSLNRDATFRIRNYSPKEFHYERFLMSSSLEEDTKIFNAVLASKVMNFLPGPHSCIGKPYAMTQIYLTTIFLLFHYHIELPPNSPHKERLQMRPQFSVVTPLNMDLVLTPLDFDKMNQG